MFMELFSAQSRSESMFYLRPKSSPKNSLNRETHETGDLRFTICDLRVGTGTGGMSLCFQCANATHGRARHSVRAVFANPNARWQAGMGRAVGAGRILMGQRPKSYQHGASPHVTDAKRFPKRQRRDSFPGEIGSRIV